MMLQLLFTSNSSSPLSREVIESICVQARANNRNAEITGILITKEDRFLQVMEGPQTAVEDAFMRMIMDARHRDLYVLSRRIVYQREFGDWELKNPSTEEEVDSIIRKISPIMENARQDARSRFKNFEAITT